MNPESRHIQRVYLFLLLLHTLAASFIWGINTLFLLDVGLTTAQAFAANAFFTAGLVVFEVPTGVIADVRGRRLSYLLGRTADVRGYPASYIGAADPGAGGSVHRLAQRARGKSETL